MSTSLELKLVLLFKSVNIRIDTRMSLLESESDIYLTDLAAALQCLLQCPRHPPPPHHFCLT